MVNQIPLRAGAPGTGSLTLRNGELLAGLKATGCRVMGMTLIDWVSDAVCPLSVCLACLLSTG